MNYKELAQSCCYLFRIGNVFYVGSTGSLDRRIRDHVWRLRKGEHPNGLLQAAWDCAPHSHKVEVLEPVSGGRDDLRACEQRWLDEFRGRVGMANKSMCSNGPSSRPDMVARWQDVDFVEKMRVVFAGHSPSDEARSKMAAAKVGAKNHKSRPVWVELGGERNEYESTRQAALALGVTQQLVDTWVKGLAPMPGRGRTCRKKHLEGMDMGYLEV